jgi:hypothetical protein
MRRQDRYANYGETDKKQVHAIPLAQRHREHASRHPNCKRSQEIVKDLNGIVKDWLS